MKRPSDCRRDLLFSLVNWTQQKVLSETAAIWGFGCPKSFLRPQMPKDSQPGLPTSPRAATEQCWLLNKNSTKAKP